MSRTKLQRLLRRGDIFYFRAAVPRGWRSAINCTEIKLTLKTSDRSVAVMRCRHLSNAFDLLFARPATLSKLTIEQLDLAVKAYFQDQLNKALILSHDLPDDPAIDIDAEIDGLREYITKLTMNLKTQSFDTFTMAKAAEIVEAQTSGQQSTTPLDLVNYARRGIVRARIENAKYLVKALSGDYSENTPTDPLFVGMQPSNFDDEVVGASTLLTVEGARQRFVAMKTGTEWVRKTELDYQRVLGLVSNVVGASKPVSLISTDDVKAVRDTLAKLPSNITKTKGNEPKSLVALIAENPEAPCISPRTQRKYFGMFRSFLHWLVEEEEILAMPGPNIKVVGATKNNPQGDRNPYSNEQLARIFTSPLYKGCSSRLRRSLVGTEIYEDGYFWIPRVALYSGLRLGEIVQLGIADIKQDGNVTYFDVSLDEGENKQLKTASSARRVPVHAKLIDFGFLKYVEQARELKKARVFHDIEFGRDGYPSHNYSKWWGRYVRKIGVQTQKTAFHSFRHNFTDALREADVPDSIAKALVGHSDSSVHSNYGSGASVQKLSEHLNRVSYPIAF